MSLSYANPATCGPTVTHQLGQLADDVSQACPLVSQSPRLYTMVSASFPAGHVLLFSNLFIYSGMQSLIEAKQC